MTKFMINTPYLHSKAPIFLLALVSIIFAFFGVKEVYRIPYLYTYDPGFHYTVTQVLDAENPLGMEIPTYDGGSINAEYPSSMRTYLVALHNISGISYLDLFKLFGIFTRIFTAFVIFYVSAYLFKNKVIALIISIFFLSSYYVFFRAIITFPENLVVPFHILVFYEVVKSIQTKRIQIALPFFIAASLTIHYPSAVIPLALLFPLVFYIARDFIKNNQLKRKLFLQTLAALGILLILSSPVLSNFLQRYQKYTKVNVGETAIELIAERGADRYEPISWSVFVQNIGAVPLLLAVVSIPIIFYKPKRENVVLLTWLAVTFIFTRGSQLTLFVPTGRMMIYFLIPVIILTGYGLKRLLDLHQRQVVYSLLFILLLLNFVKTTSNINGWQAIKESEVNQAMWLNSNLTDSTVLLNFGCRLESNGFLNFSILETREEKYVSLYQNNILQTNKIKELYTGKRVYLALNQSQSSLLLENEYLVVFDDNGNKVYDLGVQ